jgi:sphinganine-1-phosphate aldolase
VYHAGPEVEAVAQEAAALFLEENGLNPIAFPSLGRMQFDIVEMARALFHGAPEVAGYVTSGGTESILLAVKAARNRAAAERGITEPEIVMANSAHAAFHKAAAYFKLKTVTVPVGADWRADVDAMRAAVTDNTVLITGGAPSYPQGVIDPIPELAAIAAERDINFHVDACMGGWVLPFKEQLGEPVPPWDFRVPGVTSLSADIHKLGYAPKGASVVLYRDQRHAEYQTFLFDDWLGGFYWSSGLQGSKSAAPLAAAWAVLNFIGTDGYREYVRITLDATRRLIEGVRAIPGLRVLGEPDAQCVAVAAVDGDTLDIFAVMDWLAERGWHLDRQAPPDSLHATVAVNTAPAIDDLLADLRTAVAAVGASRAEDRSTDYAPRA